MIGPANPGRVGLNCRQRERNASIGHRPTMLAAAKLARPFSAARLAAPRRLSTSVPRHSDALFAVRPPRGT